MFVFKDFILGGRYNYSWMFFSHLIFLDSIKHEYKEWNDKNPQVTTCNQNTKNLILGGVIPQDVDTDKEIIFSYDVSFKVFFILNRYLSYVRHKTFIIC